MKKNNNLKVAIVMGSQSDYKTMKLAEKVLKNLGVKYETKIVSAHRTPKRMYEFATSAKKNNIGIILGGVFNSGILAKGIGDQITYRYDKIPIDIKEKYQSISKICLSHLLLVILNNIVLLALEASVK